MKVKLIDLISICANVDNPHTSGLLGACMVESNQRPLFRSQKWPHLVVVPQVSMVQPTYTTAHMLALCSPEMV